MIVASAQRIAQGGEPGTLDQSGVGSKLGPCNAPGIKRIHIIGICLEHLFFEIGGPLNKIFDLLLDRRICRPMRHVHETVVGVLGGTQRTHPVELMKQNRRQQVVYGKGIVRVALQHLLKFLNGTVVVQIVEVVEGGLIEGIARPIGEVKRSAVGLGSRQNCCEHQQQSATE